MNSIKSGEAPVFAFGFLGQYRFVSCGKCTNS